MADVSDPKIQEAYDDVRNDKTDTTWLLLAYAESKKDVLEVTATGSGSAVEEIKKHLKADQVQWAYARVTYQNDVESTRSKFIFVIYIGKDVKVMRRAKVSVQKADVIKVLKSYSIEVPIDSPEQLQESSVVSRLQAVGGAFYGPGK